MLWLFVKFSRVEVYLILIGLIKLNVIIVFKNSQQSAEVEEEAINASVFSVKERAKHLNKIQSETELQRAAHPSRKKDSRLVGDLLSESQNSYECIVKHEMKPHW